MNPIETIRAAWDALYGAALLDKHGNSRAWLQEKGKEGETALAELKRSASEPARWECEYANGNDETMVDILPFPPEDPSFYGSITPLYTAPPPATMRKPTPEECTEILRRYLKRPIITCERPDEINGRAMFDAVKAVMGGAE